MILAFTWREANQMKSWTCFTGVFTSFYVIIYHIIFLPLELSALLHSLASFVVQKHFLPYVWLVCSLDRQSDKHSCCRTDRPWGSRGETQLMVQIIVHCALYCLLCLLLWFCEGKTRLAIRQCHGKVCLHNVILQVWPLPPEVFMGLHQPSSQFYIICTNSSG